MRECCGKNYILNGELRPVEMFDNSMIYKGDSIYEVIRTIKGTPVFFNDHMERLAMSIKLQQKKMFADPEELKRNIILLARADRRKEINLKIVFNYRDGKENYLIYYIESAYPSAEQYKKGVKGILYYAERQDPGSKVINYRLKSAIHQELINEGAYEALLVNDNNQITEGSRSNVFFMKHDKLITAPDEVILKGVTRKKVLQLCEETQTEVKFECVNADDLADYQVAFMTGTSPMILPYCCINGTSFNVRLALLDNLRDLYMKKAEESLRMFGAGQTFTSS